MWKWREREGGGLVVNQAIIKLEIVYLEKWVNRISHIDLHINRTLGIASVFDKM